MKLLGKTLMLGTVWMSACGGSIDTEARDASCIAETLEDDSVVTTDVSYSSELPEGAVVASTYLRLQDERSARRRFRQLNRPMNARLAGPATGLLRMSIRSSRACNVARTMTVWESEEAMMDFVVGPEHIEAIRSVNEVSRGGSITDVWAVDSMPDLEWGTVVAGFASHDGPVY